MQITYKKIPKLVPHCGDCGKELKDGNLAYNYICKCGEWEIDMEEYYKTKSIIYILKKQDDTRK